MQRELAQGKTENQKLRDQINETRTSNTFENSLPFQQLTKEIRDGRANLVQIENLTKNEVTGKNQALREFEAIESQLMKQKQT